MPTANTSEALIRLIRIALGTAPASLGQAYSATEWKSIYGEASKQTILGLLLPAVEALPTQERPPMSVGLQWLSDQTTIKLKNERIRERASQLRKTFSEAGFRTHVLKGHSLAIFYPDPSLRQSGDIDLWVDGKRSEIMSFVKAHAKLGEILYHHCDAKFFKDVEVEIHHRPTWFYNPFFDHRFMVFAEQHKDKVFAESGAPDMVFELVYNMVHIFRHIFHEGVGLRHLIDYFYLLKASSREEKTEAYKVLYTLGLQDFCSAVMYIETEILGLPKEDSIVVGSERYGKKLFAEILQTGNFGKGDSRGETRMDKVRRFSTSFPRETLWAVPWKCWHLLWRAAHNLIKY